MIKDEALRLALEFIPSINPAFICEASHHKKHEQHASNEPCPHVAKQKQVYEAIKAALEAKDEPVAHSVVAGALFDFMGWLTSREKRLILSSVDEASPAVEAITEFAKKRNLSLKYAEVGYWMEFLSTPPQQEARDEPVALKPCAYESKEKKMCRKCGQVHAEAIWDTTPPQPVIDESAAKRIATALGLEPKRKPLTEIALLGAYEEEQQGRWGDHVRGLRAIEAAHKIKGKA